MVAGEGAEPENPNARALTITACTAAGAAFVFAGANFLAGSAAAWVDLVGGVALVGLVLARHRLSARAYLLGLCAVTIALVAAAAWAAGPLLSSYLWFFPIPPLAAHAGGRRLGVACFAVCVALILGSELAFSLGWRAEVTPLPGWFQLAVLLCAFGTSTVLAVVYDRARERAERTLTAARARAEQADQAKSRFLACMTHELRTPMHGILGLTEELLMRDLDPADRELLETVQSSGRSMLRLIDDLLDHSKMEAGKMTLEAAAFDPRLLLGEVAAWLRPRAREKGLELATEVAAEVPEALVGDAFRLRQVLLNLAGNAVKFTDRGSVRVRLAVLEPERYMFEIVDTGIGIDAAVLPQLFQSFTQADVSTSRRFGGTGLGLSISRGLVEAMGGSVTVTSVLGQGTTFRAELPLGTGAPVAAAAAARAKVDDDPRLVAERRRRTILVADDDRVNQRIAALFLERSGYRCVVVGDGVRAVEAARTSEVHAVLLDCHMPMLDGPGAAKAIRALPGSAGRVPLIALTAAAEQDGPLCLAAGMDAVLPKPVTLAQLVGAMDRWVGIAVDSSAAPRATPRGSRPPPSAVPPLLPSVAPSA